MKTYEQFIQEAQRRISQYLVYSGRSPESARRTRETSSFRNPRSGGASGTGIYGSTNLNVARTYARAAGSKPEQGDAGIVQMRVPKSQTITTKPGYEGSTQSFGLMKSPETKAVRIPDRAQPDELKTPRKFLTGVGKRDSKGDHFVLNPEYASSRVVRNPSPIIKKKKSKGKKSRLTPLDPKKTRIAEYEFGDS